MSDADVTCAQPASASRFTCKSGDPRPVRHFSREGEDVWDAAGPWTRRTARIEGAGGAALFEQENVEAPASWSQMAVDVVASKYFRGRLGTVGREYSVRQLVDRVSKEISYWGDQDEYFEDVPLRDVFRDELTVLLLTQRLSFNSPVWFNVGVEQTPQCSACFINSVDDSMESIMDLAKTEGLIFKRGSGAGVNLSALRGKNEPLSGGGTASGPVSFMRGYDAFAGVIKSGGRTRRAAKIIILNVDHPDILDFIRCKPEEERKARVLASAGFGSGLDGDASVCYQNANNAVRVTNAFMMAAERGDAWKLYARKTGEVMETVNAADLWDEIVSAAHDCGDPGLQFDDAANAWNTCLVDGRINSSNPCSEFTFLDNSACNLASLNLRRFQLEDGSLDVAAFSAAVEVSILAQDVLVDHSSYPTSKIAENSKRFRALGLGYTNLGAFLMAAGLPYDSNVGRAYAASLTALMTGVAYRSSARIARRKGSFEAWPRNSRAMTQVLQKHQNAIRGIDAGLAPMAVLEAARDVWDEALAEGVAGWRNAQVTLLAPTGTTSFMMDADTTGVEPDFSLIKRKRLSGGGELLMENGSIARALERLLYDGVEIELTLKHLRDKGTLQGSEVLPEDLAVFDCAAEDAAGRKISWTGHVLMVAAVQPFLSGAVSKTVNLPADATPEDVGQVYRLAWREGLKAVSVYRDGCKRVQPLERKSGNGGNGKSVGWVASVQVERAAGRERMPRERDSRTHKFDISGHEGYVTAGMYPDRRLGELFVVMAKEGSTVRGLLDAWATSVSIALQYGVPWDALADKFRRMRFEPSGFSDNPDIGATTSPLDYITRWVDLRFPEGRFADVPPREEAPAAVRDVIQRVAEVLRVHDSGPPCVSCGAITEPSGACHRCPTCGTSTGCG